MAYTLPIRLYVFLLCALLAANVGIYQIISTPQMLTVSVLEVGKGNATLLHSPNGKILLIDTGGDASILRALGTALPEWKRDIDTAILTSAKASSVGGLPAIESRYHIKNRLNIGDSGTPYGTEFTFDKNILITVISPGTFSISRGTNSLLISSSSPPRIYTMK